MLVTVDLSVAAAWLLPDEASPGTDDFLIAALTGQLRLQAPGLWAWEAGNLLRMATLRKRLLRRDWGVAMRTLDEAAVRLEPMPDMERFAQTLALALDAGLTFYDASYLEQARRTRASLASKDAALLRAAKKAGVTCLTL